MVGHALRCDARPARRSASSRSRSTSSRLGASSRRRSPSSRSPTCALVGASGRRSCGRGRPPAARRPFTALQTWAAPRALRRAGHLDGIVQIGTGYTLDTDMPIATFEDMTVLQTKTHPYLGWDLLSDARLRAPSRAPAPRLRGRVAVLPDQPLGGRVGDPRLRDRAGEGPRRRRRPQPQRAPRGRARLEHPALPLRRHGLAAQERRRRAARVRSPARGAAGRAARRRRRAIRRSTRPA